MSDERPADDELGPSGFGEDEQLRRSDINLFEQALRADWPIAPVSRNWILRRLAREAEKGKSPRVRLAALKTLMTATSLNIKQQALDLARARFEADNGGDEGPTAADVVKEMQAAAERYEREHPDETPADCDGTGEVPGEPEPLQ